MKTGPAVVLPDPFLHPQTPHRPIPSQNEPSNLKPSASKTAGTPKRLSGCTESAGLPKCTPLTPAWRKRAEREETCTKKSSPEQPMKPRRRENRASILRRHAGKPRSCRKRGLPLLSPHGGYNAGSGSLTTIRPRKSYFGLFFLFLDKKESDHDRETIVETLRGNASYCGSIVLHGLPARRGAAGSGFSEGSSGGETGAEGRTFIAALRCRGRDTTALHHGRKLRMVRHPRRRMADRH